MNTQSRLHKDWGEPILVPRWSSYLSRRITNHVIYGHRSWPSASDWIVPGTYVEYKEERIKRWIVPQ